MPVDFINISSIWPTDGNPLGVNGDLNIVGASPRYLVNGNPMGMVSTISPGGLSGAVTLSAGANMSITQSGQTITFASTGGGGGGTSQWLDAVGGGIYYGGHVGILNTDPEAALDVNGLIRSTSASGIPTTGVGANLFYHTLNDAGYLHAYDFDAALYKPLVIEGAPVRMNWSSGASVNIGSTTNPNLGSLQIARSDGSYQLALERSGPNDPQIYAWYISNTPGNPFLSLNDVTHGHLSRLIIAPDGNVGIGTTTPTANLHVAGGAKVGAAAFNHASGDLGVSRNGEPTGGVIYFGSSGSSYLYFDGVGFTLQGGNLYVPESVGIGVSPPSTKLHVVGNALIGSGSLEIQSTAPNPTITFHFPFVSIFQMINYGDRLSMSTGGGEWLSVNVSGNVGVGTNSPTSRFHVSNGRSSFQNQAEPYCIALWGSNTANPTYVGTDVWGNMTIHDVLGTPKYMFTQNGILTANGGAPFDPGSSHLQVYGGLCVNTMADNNLSSFRIVSNDQAWGLGIHSPGSLFYFFTTNAWDAYGGWAAFPLTIDASNGAVGIGQLNAGNISATGTINAAAFTVNGQPLSNMGAQWTSFPCDIRNSAGNVPIALAWGYAWYRIHGPLCFLNVSFYVNDTQAGSGMHMYLPQTCVVPSYDGVVFMGFPDGTTSRYATAQASSALQNIGWVTGINAGWLYQLTAVYRVA